MTMSIMSPRFKSIIRTSFFSDEHELCRRQIIQNYTVCFRLGSKNPFFVEVSKSVYVHVHFDYVIQYGGCLLKQLLMKLIFPYLYVLYLCLPASCFLATAYTCT